MEHITKINPYFIIFSISCVLFIILIILITLNSENDIDVDQFIHTL